MRLLTLLGSAAIGSVAATQGALRLARTAVTVGFEMAAGDLAEQHIEQRSAIRPFRWDRERSRRLGLTGLCTTGPLAHTLFEGLESMVPGTAVKSVLTKVVLNAVRAACGCDKLPEGLPVRTPHIQPHHTTSPPACRSSLKTKTCRPSVRSTLLSFSGSKFHLAT